jgi:hypothetical protein
MIYVLAVKKLEHFKPKKAYALFCPVGQVSFDEMAELISRAVLRCRREKITKRLIDSRGVPGFRPPPGASVIQSRRKNRIGRKITGQDCARGQSGVGAFGKIWCSGG